MQPNADTTDTFELRRDPSSPGPRDTLQMKFPLLRRSCFAHPSYEVEVVPPARPLAVVPVSSYVSVVADEALMHAPVTQANFGEGGERVFHTFVEEIFVHLDMRQNLQFPMNAQSLWCMLFESCSTDLDEVELTLSTRRTIRTISTWGAVLHS
jgi:hypothetical protein